MSDNLTGVREEWSIQHLASAPRVPDTGRCRGGCKTLDFCSSPIFYIR